MNNSLKTQKPSKPNSQQQKYLAKIIVLGNSAVGKTSILSRYTWNGHGIYQMSHTPTIGIDFKTKTLDVDNTLIKLQIWDTAGQQKYRTLTDNYFAGSAGIVLVYSITDRKTFEQISDWIYHINNKVGQQPVRIILGNKCDAGGRNNSGQQKRVVQTYEGRMLAQKYKTMFFEVSAKENINIEEAFLMLTKKMLQKLRENPNYLNQGVMKLSQDKQIKCKKKQNHCCS